MATVAVVVFLIGFPNYPGRINADTSDMIGQVRSGTITDWHSWLLQVVWRAVDPSFPPGALFIAQLVVLAVASLALLRVVLGPVASRVSTAVVWLNPFGYALASEFTRDTWALIGFLSAMAAVVYARRPQRQFAARTALWGAFAISVVIVVGSRQNAGAFLMPPAFVLAWHRWGGHRRWRRALAGLAGAAAVAIGCLVILPRFATPLGVTASGPETAIMVADLQAFSAYTGKVEVPSVAHSPGLSVADIERLSSIYNSDQIWYSGHPPTVYTQLPPAARAVVKRAWLHMIEHHPVTWLKIRTHLFLRQIGLTGPTRNSSLPAGIANSVGMHPAEPEAAADATDWMRTVAVPDTFAGRLLTRAWIWILLAAAACALLIRRRRPGTVLLFSAALYALSLFPGAPAMQYRFVAPSVVIATGLLVCALAMEAEAAILRARKHGPSSRTTDDGSREPPMRELASQLESP